MSSSQSQNGGDVSSQAATNAEPSASFTPGPWHAMTDAVYSGSRGQNIVASTDVGTTNWGGRNANARLIAAAPDLLHALRLCVQRIAHPNLSPDANVVLERAVAALAKAEGRS